ncbi:response regulator [Gemmata sp. JC673]|uniref:Response regulator n=1 Tax=Gemmata algarum TaxID=2975278 RepID=A0ABU5EV32_9BACT|nr:response regulator [Gemmata algarum]MDY3559162.1 response regulator [Gemmata algarum]
MTTPGLILVIDDEAIVRNVLAKLAEHLGYRVTTASSGAEAVEMCQKETPTAVILDVRMPELDGPATLDALRHTNPDLPCVFVSGNPSPYTVEELLARGKTAFVNKPAALSQLEAAFARVIPAGEGRR